jgi:RNA polymerase sigma factor for flagellar operon FliA
MLEQRRTQRTDTRVWCVLRNGTGRSAAGQIVNLSEGGALVDVKLALVSGDVIEIAFPAGPNELPSPLRAMVVRAGPAIGVAVAWRELSPNDQKQLRAFVSARAKMAWDEGEGVLPRGVAEAFVPIIRQLAWTITRRVSLPSHLGIDDLTGAGFLALVELHRRCPDLPRDELERLGRKRIRGAMLDELRAADIVPRSVRRHQRAVATARRALGVEPDSRTQNDALRARAGLSREQFDEAEVARAIRWVPSDSTFPAAVEGPEEHAMRHEAADRASRALAALPERLRKILELHYGSDMTLRAIGNILGVTEARISQLVDQAKRKLRESCAEDAAR